MQTPKPGEILLGKYRVEEIIGVGGMGRVVKASHLYLQQPVAIKILLPEMALVPVGEEHFVYLLTDGRVKLTKIKMGQRRAGASLGAP